MLKNKKILIMGSGLTGKAAYDFAVSRGATAVFFDENTVDDKKRFDFAIISPGISKYKNEYIKVKGSGIPIFSELDFAYLNNPFRSLSVSGTNGKTTVALMVTGMLNRAGIKTEPIGNMGIPFCSFSSDCLKVAEISSFTLEQSKFFKTDYSCITNITVDHLQYHGTQKKYENAKYKLFSFTDKGIVYNPSRFDVSKYTKDKKTMTYSVDGTADLFVYNNTIFYKDSYKTYKIINIDEMKISGKHNVENTLSALGLCIISNGLLRGYDEFLREYKGEKFRNEYRGVINAKKIYNDSKGTNVSSTVASLETMKGATAILLGGFDKGESFSPLFEKTTKNDVIYAFGDNSEKICSEAGKHNVRNHLCKTLEEAVIKALSDNVDNVLFSPACSSFDRFQNFEKRGEFFDEFIEKFKR